MSVETCITIITMIMFVCMIWEWNQFNNRVLKYAKFRCSHRTTTFWTSKIVAWILKLIFIERKRERFSTSPLYVCLHGERREAKPLNPPSHNSSTCFFYRQWDNEIVHTTNWYARLRHSTVRSHNMPFHLISIFFAFHSRVCTFDCVHQTASGSWFIWYVVGHCYCYCFCDCYGRPVAMHCVCDVYHRASLEHLFQHQSRWFKAIFVFFNQFFFSPLHFHPFCLR